MDDFVTSNDLKIIIDTYKNIDRYVAAYVPFVSFLS